MDDWIRRIMTDICKRFGRPSSDEMAEETDVLDKKIEKYDSRLSKVERELSEQEARVWLLEQQADPRGRFSSER